MKMGKVFILKRGSSLSFIEPLVPFLLACLSTFIAQTVLRNIIIFP